MITLLAAAALLLVASSAQAAPDFTFNGLVDGQVVKGSITVGAIPSGATSPSFTFALVDASGRPVSIPGQTLGEWAAPYCLMGDNGVTCAAWNTATVPDGTYSLRAVMSSTTAAAITKSAGFTIANSSPPPAATSDQTATVEYDEPTKNADGSPLNDLAITRVYCQPPGQPELVCETVPAAKFAGGTHVKVFHVFKAIAPGTVVPFRVTSVDTSGNESSFSPIVRWTAAAAAKPGKAGVTVKVVNE